MSEGNINKAQGLNDVLSRAFELGTKNIGGGVIGTFASFIMVKLLGITGTVIASIGFSIICFVMLFSLHPAEAIANYLENTYIKLEEKNNEVIIRIKEKENMNNGLHLDEHRQ